MSSLICASSGLIATACIAPGAITGSTINPTAPAAAPVACQTTDANFNFKGATSASALSSSVAQVSWDSTNPSCSYIYRVYQIPDLNTPIAYATGGSAASITGLNSGQTYQFVARVFDGKSEDTNLTMVSVTMPAPPLGAFSINSVTPSTNHRPTISWTTSTNAQTYDLLISWDVDSTHTEAYTLQETGLTTTSYTPTTDIPFGKYWVWVTAKATNSTSAVATNAPITMTIYPQLTGCLQTYGRLPSYVATPVSPTSGWRSNCIGSFGNANGYFQMPSNLTYEPSSGYLYIMDQYGLARWDMNSFQPQGFMHGDSNRAFVNTNTIYSTAAYGNFPIYDNVEMYPFLGVSKGGCSDGTYVYLPGVAKIYRIKISTQTLEGFIGGGIDGWQTSGAPAFGATYQHFGDPAYSRGPGSVACNATNPYLYIADTGNQRISRWNKNGTAAGVWGKGTAGTWATTSPATCCTVGATGPANAGQALTAAGEFYNPSGIVMAASGNIYIADRVYWGNSLARLSKLSAANLNAPILDGWQCNNVIGWQRTIVAAAPYCTHEGGNSRYLVYGTHYQLAVDSLENIYVSNPNNVLKYTSTGAYVGATTNSGAYSNITFADPLGVAVKPDGSLLMVSDTTGARVMLYDNNLMYLGYIGGGNVGIAPATAARPAIAGPGVGWPASAYPAPSGSAGLLIDRPNDAMLIGETNTSTAVIAKYSLSNGNRIGDSQFTGGVAGYVSGVGQAPQGFDTSSGRMALSLTGPYLYVVGTSPSGRILRVNKNTLEYAGWTGNDAVRNPLNSWQTTATTGLNGSTVYCGLYYPNQVVADAGGYLYVTDLWSGKIAVFNESTGACIGQLGGTTGAFNTANIGTFPATVHQKAIYSGGFWNYTMPTFKYGKYFYIANTGMAIYERWTGASSPTTLTWNSWMGGIGAKGWSTASLSAGKTRGPYQGDGTGMAYADSNTEVHRPVGGGLVAILNQNNFVKFLSLTDGSYFGNLFASTDYSISLTVPPDFPRGYFTGNGMLWSYTNTTTPYFSYSYYYSPKSEITYDSIGQDMYVFSNGGAPFWPASYGGGILRFH